jgi:glycine/D-amino acid oxidase-like deaminating enzyme
VKVLICGRGFSGLSLALEMLTRGHQVVVAGMGISLDSKEQNLRPASLAAVGISSNKGHFLADSDLFELKLRGHRGLQSWINSLELTSSQRIPMFRSQVFEPFFNKEEYGYLHERIFHGNPSGFYLNRIISYQEFAKNIGGTSLLMEPLGAFQYVEDLWFDPHSCLRALEIAILKLGGQIVNGALEGLVWAGDKYGKVRCRIRLNPHDTTYFCDVEQIVLACGSYTNDTLNRINLGVKLPFRLCSGSTLNYKMQSNSEKKWALRIKKNNIVAYNNELIVGSSSVNHVSDYHSQIDFKKSEQEQYLSQINHQLEKMFRELEWSHQIWGVRLRTNDRYPVMGSLTEISDQVEIKIDSCIIQRLWIFTGMYKNGLQLSWLLAKDLADALEFPITKAIDRRLSLKRIMI